MAKSKLLQWRMGWWSWVACWCWLCSAAVAADNDFALVRPWIADELKLSDEQRGRILVIVREFQSAMQAAADSYPLGGQDAEGTHQRERIEKSVRATQERLNGQVQSLLSDEQLDRFRALKPTAPKATVKFEGRRSFAALLWPDKLEALKLNAGQHTRLNAILRTGTADWLTSEGDPDARLQAQRDRVLRDLREVLTAEQLKLLPEKPSARDPMMILIGRSPYDLFGDAAVKQAAMARNSELRTSLPKTKLTPVDGLKSMVRVGREFGEPLEPVFWHPESQRILAAAISPNERFVVTLGSSVPGLQRTHEIRMWDARTGDLLAIAPNDPFGGASTGRSGSIRFLSSECVLFNVEPFGR